ncbi:head decoration protein [Vallitaleaceae bacterium 9-2]
MGNLYEQTGSYEPDNLIVGNTINTSLKGITIASGQGVLNRGTVIGIITASGLGKVCNTASADGSEVASVILADEVDTNEADVVAECYQSGEFNRDALIFGGTDTASDHEKELRTVNIILKDAV